MRLTFPKVAALVALFAALALVLPMMGWPHAIFVVFAYFVMSLIIARW